MRDRDLRATGYSLAPGEPELLARTLDARPPGARVLELGCGEARTLLELAARFPDMRFCGVDRNGAGPNREVEDIGLTAARHGLAPPATPLELFRYPFGLAPQDAAERGEGAALHFADETFDLVYSSAVIRFLPDKVGLIEEACRTLKVGGVAILDLDDSPEASPACRLVVEGPDGPRAFLEHLCTAAGAGWDVRVVHPRKLVVEITRRTRAPLVLGLRFHHYVPREDMPVRGGALLGGVRSVYRPGPRIDPPVAPPRGTGGRMQTWVLTGSPENHAATREHGYEVIGLKERNRRRAELIEPGDRIVLYATKVMAFAGSIVVAGGLYEDRAKIWPGKPGKVDPYPWRFPTRPEAVIDDPDRWVPAEELVDELEHVAKWPREHWKLAFQGQIRPVSEHDAGVLLDRLGAVAGAPAAS